MHSESNDLVIYEGKLAQEFGVSRTPVRQVIQSLAAERMVEVRSGVGTIATPMLPERRIKDLRAFLSILTACSECTVEGSIKLVLMEFSSLRLFLEHSQGELSNELFFDISSKFASSLFEMVEDNILKDALIACYWRYIRRRLAELEGNFEQGIDEISKLIAFAEDGAKDGNAEQVLLKLRDGVDSMIDTATTV